MASDQGVKRFNDHNPIDNTFECEDGEWIYAKDHDRVVAELKANALQIKHKNEKWFDIAARDVSQLNETITELRRQLEESQQNLETVRSVLTLTEESEDELEEQLETARLVIDKLREQRNFQLQERYAEGDWYGANLAILLQDCEIEAIEKQGDAT